MSKMSKADKTHIHKHNLRSNMSDYVRPAENIDHKTPIANMTQQNFDQVKKSPARTKNMGAKRQNMQYDLPLKKKKFMKAENVFIRLSKVKKVEQPSQNQTPNSQKKTPIQNQL